MLSFENTKDPESNDVKRDDVSIGFLMWHPQRGPARLQFHDKNAYLTAEEMQLCLKRLEEIKKRPSGQAVSS